MKTEDRAYDQARAQAESIAEMVAKLDEREAAKIHVREEMTPEQRRSVFLAAPLTAVAATDDDIADALCEGIDDGDIAPDDLPGFEWSEDDARQAILDDALSLAVRSGWYSPGETPEPEEFAILLCTGGPAVRIRGELSAHREPERAWIEYQGWGTPWTEYHGDGCEQETLLTYCRQFYFGE